MTAQIQSRACAFCVFANRASGQCWHPTVTRARGPVPLVVARSEGEACGLEARLLNVPGWTDRELAGVRSWET